MTELVGKMDAEAKDADATTARRAWLGLLARAERQELEAFWQKLEPKPEFEMLRAPEIGLVMARGRTGGTGRQFNFGEVAVARCSIRLDGGWIGHGYTRGRDRSKARLIAILDAMLQAPEWHQDIADELLQPLRQRLQEERTRRAEEAAATKVDFFTLARETT